MVPVMVVSPPIANSLESLLSFYSIFPHSFVLLLCLNPDQVMQVVREQITRALAMKPSSLDQLKNKLRGLNYSEILRLRQSERMSQDDFQSPPIMSVSTQPLNCTDRVLSCQFNSLLKSQPASLTSISAHQPFPSNRLRMLPLIIINGIVPVCVLVFVPVAHAVFVLQ